MVAPLPDLGSPDQEDNSQIPREILTTSYTRGKEQNKQNKSKMHNSSERKLFSVKYLQVSNNEKQITSNKYQVTNNE